MNSCKGERFLDTGEWNSEKKEGFKSEPGPRGRLQLEEVLRPLEVLEDVLPLLGELVARGGALVSEVLGLVLVDELLGHEGVQGPLERLPGEVGPVHDAGRLPGAVLDGPQDVEVDLQLRSAVLHLPLTLNLYRRRTRLHYIGFPICSL